MTSLSFGLWVQQNGSSENARKEKISDLIRGYQAPPIHQLPSAGGTPFLEGNELRSLREYYDFRTHGGRPLEETPVGRILVKSHWFLAVPALPVDQSDAVVLGTMVENQAYLTESGSAIFTVYHVQLESIFTSLRELPPGDRVTVTREGGSIQLKNGKVLDFRVDGQGYPRSGEQYLLFLDRIPGIASYRLLDGYCTSGDWVVPFDERPNHDYAGTKTETLLKIVRGAYPQRSWKRLP